VYFGGRTRPHIYPAAGDTAEQKKQLYMSNREERLAKYNEDAEVLSHVIVGKVLTHHEMAMMCDKVKVCVTPRSVNSSCLTVP
jgi:homogentisate 1,2-dioxygenase